ISKVVILDYFGGFHEVGVDDYMNTNLSSMLEIGVSQTTMDPPSWFSGHPIVWMMAGFLLGWLVSRYSGIHSTTGAQYRTVPDATKTSETMEMEVDAEASM
ncbi:hypothetical protein FisN_2Hu008, partial [Fistulifera solaris]